VERALLIRDPADAACAARCFAGRMILVAHASRHGSTRETAEAVAGELRTLGLDVEVAAAAEVRSVEAYDAVVLGGALYTGRLHKDARAFLRRHGAERPLAVFAMGPKTLAADEVAASRAQLDKALAGLEPVSAAIFGGVVDPAKLRFPFSRMPASDARDWDAVRAWARDLAEQLPVAAGSRV
jgi:menaquinone-dependent protoporphyrinogen oxidase